jgi:hypothetical protein
MENEPVRGRSHPTGVASCSSSGSPLRDPGGPILLSAEAPLRMTLFSETARQPQDHRRKGGSKHMPAQALTHSELQEGTTLLQVLPLSFHKSRFLTLSTTDI